MQAIQAVAPGGLASPGVKPTRLAHAEPVGSGRGSMKNPWVPTAGEDPGTTGTASTKHSWRPSTVSAGDRPCARSHVSPAGSTSRTTQAGATSVPADVVVE